MFKNKVGRQSNEVIKKRRILNIVWIAIIFVVLFSWTYVLTNITTKKLMGGGGPIYYGIACAEETACYQAGFRNGNLYQRVIDEYNYENNASLSYEDVITDGQLLSITHLYAEGGNIDDVTGIEKLVNLEELCLEDNNLTSVDLGSLVNLINLDISINNLVSINLSDLTNLKYLDLSLNNLTSINLSNLTELQKLYLSCNNLNEINIDNLINLTKLELDNNSLSEINLSNNTNITYLSLDLNICGTIDFGVFNNLDNINVNMPLLISESINIGDYLDFIDEYEVDEFHGSNLLTYQNGVLTSLFSGDFDLLLVNRYNNIHHIEISGFIFNTIESNKYEINQEYKYLYVGEDNDDEIANNIILNYEEICEDFDNINECLSEMENDGLFYGININNNNLEYKLSYKEGRTQLVYTLGRIDLSGDEVNEKEITVNGVFNYEEVPHDNVELEYSNNTLIVKDLNGNEVDRYAIREMVIMIQELLILNQ